jgi:hypothetical protein
MYNFLNSEACICTISDLHNIRDLSSTAQGYLYIALIGQPSLTPTCPLSQWGSVFGLSTALSRRLHSWQSRALSYHPVHRGTIMIQALLGRLKIATCVGFSGTVLLYLGTAVLVVRIASEATTMFIERHIIYGAKFDR